MIVCSKRLTKVTTSQNSKREAPSSYLPIWNFIYILNIQPLPQMTGIPIKN